MRRGYPRGLAPSGRVDPASALRCAQRCALHGV